MRKGLYDLHRPDDRFGTQHLPQRGRKERPLTHDLLSNVLTALGGKVERVVINDFKNGVYFGRLIISAENELHQHKIMEIDARSSDCMAMAALQRAPIYVSHVVWDEVEDMRPSWSDCKTPKKKSPPANKNLPLFQPHARIHHRVKQVGGKVAGENQGGNNEVQRD